MKGPPKVTPPCRAQSTWAQVVLTGVQVGFAVSLHPDFILSPNKPWPNYRSPLSKQEGALNGKESVYHFPQFHSQNLAQMPLIPEHAEEDCLGQLSRWGSHFQGCNSSPIHTAEDGVYTWAHVPHRSQGRMKGARLASLLLLRASLQGPKPKKDKTESSNQVTHSSHD